VGTPFCKTDKRIAQLWQKLSEPGIIGTIYDDLMHETLAKTW